MIKKFGTIISLLLALLLLCGCTAPAATLREEYVGPIYELETFDKIEYERPDKAELAETVDALCRALESPFKFGEINRLLDVFYTMYAEFETMYMVAYIRYCQDMSDDFYEQEYNWLVTAEAELQLLVESVYYACADSMHGLWLEKLKFWDGFRDEYSDGDAQDEAFAEEYMALLRRESELLNRYRDETLTPTIEISGQEEIFHDYISQVGGEDFTAAYDLYYEKYGAELGEIYVELISVRRDIAELMGYDSYALMEYELSYGREYSLDEARAYMEYIKRYLAPLGRELTESGAYYTLAMYEPVSAEDLLFLLETAAEGFGGSIAEAFGLMKEFELYDFEYGPNKADISFTSYLTGYELPYIFLSPYGDTGDILTVFHEFGHYADSYIRYNAYESIDLSESFSQAMQLLGLGELENVLSAEDLEILRNMSLMEILNSFLLQSALAEFELCAYEMENPSVEKLSELSLELSKEYGIYNEDSEGSYKYLWVDTPHLYETPMYVISYPASAGTALEIYQLELEKEEAGIECFETMSACGLEGLRETLDYVGLQDPMSESQVEKAADFLRKALIK